MSGDDLEIDITEAEVDALATVLEHVRDSAAHNNTGGKIPEAFLPELALALASHHGSVFQGADFEIVGDGKALDEFLAENATDFHCEQKIQFCTTSDPLRLYMRSKTPQFKHILHGFLHLLMELDERTHTCKEAQTFADTLNKLAYDELAERKYAALRKECATLGLDAEGKEATLRKKLSDFYATKCTEHGSEQLPVGLEALRQHYHELLEGSDNGNSEPEPAAEANEPPLQTVSEVASLRRRVAVLERENKNFERRMRLVEDQCKRALSAKRKEVDAKPRGDHKRQKPSASTAGPNPYFPSNMISYWPMPMHGMPGMPMPGMPMHGMQFPMPPMSGATVDDADED